MDRGEQPAARRRMGASAVVMDALVPRENKSRFSRPAGVVDRAIAIVRKLVGSRVSREGIAIRFERIATARFGEPKPPLPRWRISREGADSVSLARLKV